MDEKDTTNRLILEHRARKLARPMDDATSRDETLALLEFSLGGLRYAVPLAKVHAVTRVSEITAIPLAPRHIPGVIRRRGESIALVNLDYFFDAERTGIADADYAIVVSAAAKRFALQVEDVIGVVLMAQKDLVPPQDNFDPAQVPYVSAVTREGLVVLNLDSLVTARGFSAEKTIG